MAAPAYATDLTTFWLEGATTVSALGGGGAALSNPETDFFIQGSDCISKGAFTNSTKGFIIDGLGANFTVPTDGAVIGFAKYDAAGSLSTKSAGGFRFLVGSSDGDYENYYCGGNDTIAFNSWVPYVVDPNTATSDATVGSPAGTERWVGILADLPTTSGPTKGNPIAMDAIRYGRCTIEYTLGDLGNGYATFNGAEAVANATTARWGLLELLAGAYQTQGFHSIGTAATAVDFRDANKVLFWRKQDTNLTNDAVSTAFNRVEIINAGTNCDWENIIWSALGTRSRGTFIHTAGTFDAIGCQFFDWNTFTFLSTSLATDCTFARCNAITAPGSTLNRSKVLLSTVDANTSALVWAVATDPTGLLDDMEFSKGTNAHHAIELGLTSPLTMTFNNPVSVGFSASNDVNDSFFHVKRTTGTVTINVLGGTGNFSYRTDGATVNVVPNPITINVTAALKDGTPVENALVYLRAANGTGPFPYLDTVTITRSGTVATVAHTAHGLESNDKVAISGITDKTEDNGLRQITVTGVNSYTFVTTNAGSTSYTGTIRSTFVAISGLTNASGLQTTSKVYPSNQPVIGWTRKSSGSPYLQEGVLVGTISSTLGFEGTAVMLSDE
jgi:hypothetical protein